MITYMSRLAFFSILAVQLLLCTTYAYPVQFIAILTHPSRPSLCLLGERHDLCDINRSFVDQYTQYLNTHANRPITSIVELALDANLTQCWPQMRYFIHAIQRQEKDSAKALPYNIRPLT